MLIAFACNVKSFAIVYFFLFFSPVLSGRLLDSHWFLPKTLVTSTGLILLDTLNKIL